MISKNTILNHPDRIKSPEEIKPGMTIFKTYALGSSSFVDEIHVESSPQPVVLGENFTALFIDCNGRKLSESLGDAGITDKPHNNHLTFRTEETAITYKVACIFDAIGAGDML